MCGEYGNTIHLYYGNESGSIGGGKLVSDINGNTQLGTGRFTGPAIADLDGDGLKDLMVACSKEGIINSYDGPGGIKFYKNIGSLGDPKYEYQGFIKDKNGNEIRHVYLRIQIADMDNDSLLDIITSNTVDKNKPDIPSAIYMYKNIGTATEPVFDTAEILTHVDGSEIPGDYAIRIGVGDINNDGIKDIFYNTSHHFPGKVGILIGNLGVTANGNMKYSVSKGKASAKLNGNVVTLKGIANIKVFNSAGKLIKNKNFNNIVNIINLDKLDLGKGFHMIEIKNGGNTQILKYIRKE